eukprot:INCI14909.1.p1 GENE.INCI14909.1~~INCI14909.1.p1  ORF type:complete len:258 (-),score=58.40 INCI14909.1:62-835(-)
MGGGNSKKNVEDVIRPIGALSLPRQPYSDKLDDESAVFLRKDHGTYGELMVVMSPKIGTLLPNNFHTMLQGRISKSDYQARLFALNEALVKLKNERDLRTGPDNNFINFQREYSMNRKRVLDWARDKEKRLLDTFLLMCVEFSKADKTTIGLTWISDAHVYSEEDEEWGKMFYYKVGIIITIAKKNPSGLCLNNGQLEPYKHTTIEDQHKESAEEKKQKAKEARLNTRKSTNSLGLKMSGSRKEEQAAKDAASKPSS